jgi:hypothetical protein
MLVLTHAEKAPERHDGIGNPAADLLNHQALDRPDLVSARVVTVVPSTRSLSIRGLPVIRRTSRSEPSMLP